MAYHSAHPPTPCFEPARLPGILPLNFLPVMRFRSLWPLPALLFTLACSDTSDPAKVLMYTDFDSVDGWAAPETNAVFSRDKAHSGNVSIKVGPGAEYSPGYTNALGKISESKLTTILVKGWVFIQDLENKPKLVVEVKNTATNKDILWEGIELDKKVKKRGGWAEFEQEITLPAEAKADDLLILYAWAPGATAATYLDDIEVARP